jgi:hypothetical protein
MKNYDWIDSEELPVRADLKVVRINDPDFGLTQDEIDDRDEFIRCYILQDFEAILRLPVQRLESDFFIENWRESAFNTIDYYRDYPQNRFYRYAYKIRKIMEEVKHLAILYSCISDPEGRIRIQSRYKNLVEDEFRNKAVALISRYKMVSDEQIRNRIRSKVAELNERIMQCKRVWEQYAPPFKMGPLFESLQVWNSHWSHRA